MPAGLTKLKAVEGAEVVLPVWYTLQGQVSSGQTWELLAVMWFLEQEGKDLNQVREQSISARGWLHPVTEGREELRRTGGVAREWGTGKEFQENTRSLMGSVFVLSLEAAPKNFLVPSFP